MTVRPATALLPLLLLATVEGRTQPPRGARRGTQRRRATRRVFTLFDAWTASSDDARRAVARGQALFDESMLGPSRATCSGCHNTPNVGSSSTGAFFEGAHHAPDPALPLYTLRCSRGSMAGQTLRTNDPGWGW